MVCRQVGVWCAGLALGLVIDSAAMADSITGMASVLDGDTLELDGEHIRVLNIDAPELDQICIAPSDNGFWNCGQEAARALQSFLSQYSVTCETRGTDYSGRWFGLCNVPGMSIASWMAAQGWAVPNRDCQCEEVRAWAAFAKSKNVGIWGSKFDMPWIWRKTN